MQPQIAAHLLELNYQFYQTFALQFSATRGRLQPGVKRLLSRLLASRSLLDLGCGNGELARELARRQYSGIYVGLDSNAELLYQARRGLPAGLNAILVQADLATPGWEQALPQKSFQACTAFAVLHHLPGEALRGAVIAAARRHLQPEGLFIHSHWQFLRSARLRGRLQPWERLGFSAADVDPGDYLLDWRGGGSGLRYVHHFSPEELQHMASDTGFQIVETFTSDGENGRLGLYQVWQPA